MIGVVGSDRGSVIVLNFRQSATTDDSPGGKLRERMREKLSEQ